MDTDVIIKCSRFRSLLATNKATRNEIVLSYSKIAKVIDHLKKKGDMSTDEVLAVFAFVKETYNYFDEHGVSFKHGLMLTKDYIESEAKASLSSSTGAVATRGGAVSGSSAGGGAAGAVTSAGGHVTAAAGAASAPASPSASSIAGIYIYIYKCNVVSFVIITKDYVNKPSRLYSCCYKLYIFTG